MFFGKNCVFHLGFNLIISKILSLIIHRNGHNLSVEWNQNHSVSKANLSMRDCRGFSMSDWVKTIYVVRAKRSEIFSGNVSSQYAHRTLMDRGYSKCVELNCFLQHFRNCFEVRNFSKTVSCILNVRSRPETKAFLSFLILESNI